MTELSLVQAVNLALKRAMADDPRVVVLGEDVGVDGGVFPCGDQVRNARRGGGLRRIAVGAFG